jgi:hypothetical protein
VGLPNPSPLHPILFASNEVYVSLPCSPDQPPTLIRVTRIEHASYRELVPDSTSQPVLWATLRGRVELHRSRIRLFAKKEMATLALAVAEEHRTDMASFLAGIESFLMAPTIFRLRTMLYSGALQIIFVPRAHPLAHLWDSGTFATIASIVSRSSLFTRLRLSPMAIQKKDVFRMQDAIASVWRGASNEQSVQLPRPVQPTRPVQPASVTRKRSREEQEPA